MSRAATAGSRRMSSYRMPLPNPQLPCKGGDWSLDICAVFLEQKLPSLANEGWLRPLRKSGEASLAGADGVVRSSHQLLEVERTTPSAPSKERDHLLDGASTPPSPPVACVSWSGAKREIRDVSSGLLKKALLKMSKLQSRGL